MKNKVRILDEKIMKIGESGNFEFDPFAYSL